MLGDGGRTALAETIRHRAANRRTAAGLSVDDSVAILCSPPPRIRLRARTRPLVPRPGSGSAPRRGTSESRGPAIEDRGPQSDVDGVHGPVTVVVRARQ